MNGIGIELQEQKKIVAEEGLLLSRLNYSFTFDDDDIE
jgi:hypothetical protein